MNMTKKKLSAKEVFGLVSKLRKKGVFIEIGQLQFLGYSVRYLQISQEKHAEDFLCLPYQIFELKIMNFFNMS